MVATEVEQVLSDLYPLLRTVQPAELNMTLNALATALEGRGDQLGENLETVDSYLKRLNPQIPALVEDLRLTAAGLRHLRRRAAPDRARSCDNTVTTTGTLEDREAKLQRAVRRRRRSSPTRHATFLDDNGDNLIRLGEVSRAQLRVLARYSPEFPCLLEGIVNAGELPGRGVPRLHAAHRPGDAARTSRARYDADDEPRFGEDRGPTCLHLPNPPWIQANPVSHQPDFDDGVDEPTGKGTSRVAPGYGRPRPARRQLRRRRRLAGGSELLGALLAPGLGATPSRCPTSASCWSARWPAAPPSRGRRGWLR